MRETISILMLPWLAHGHISPFLELAKRLADRNLRIHICSSPMNLESIRSRIPEKYSSSIRLLEIHLPSLPELPPQRHTTNGLPLHLMPVLKRAFDMSAPNFAEILVNLKPDLLIYDFLMPWAPELARSHNVRAVTFLSVGAGMASFVFHLLKNPGVDFPFEGLFSVDDHVSQMFCQILESPSSGITDKDRVLQCIERSSDILLMKTFRELEGKYIDCLSDLTGKRAVPVGPLVHDPLLQADQAGTHIIEWLDKKPISSTVFVSFGTEYFLTDQEREEIAHGLERSNVNFIWVMRFPGGERQDLEDALPKGFLERVAGRGLVVEKWAPQVRILEHESIGGFVSHCGWSSVMESMKFGVPIIAVPMQLDQPFNAKVVERVGVGIEVKRNPSSGRFEGEDIGRVIRGLVKERGGEGVRKRVKEVSESMIRNKGKDEEIDGVVDALVNLCGK
ncbi:UDP-glucosyltransferase 29-like [Punica granatum]|uniref:Glycosyltransferase n=2 Tax=Punica granatum TaxID=22663 RepID=A0A6P8BNR2_PUNGR|nr:UDP-glucosyltransferase 29-like [Punica granatum]